jgi:hypothetical protein
MPSVGRTTWNSRLSSNTVATVGAAVAAYRIRLAAKNARASQ